jgi:IMP dehydrogenase
MTYAGARDIEEFQAKAVVGIQSSAGYQEGQSVETNWD